MFGFATLVGLLLSVIYYPSVCFVLRGRMSKSDVRIFGGSSPTPEQVNPPNTQFNPIKPRYKI